MQSYYWKNKVKGKRVLSILKQTIQILHNAQLLEGYEHFSTHYAQRNAGWLSYQLHKDRDFTVETAINVLRYVRKVKSFYLEKTRLVGVFAEECVEAHEQIDRLIQAHLEDRYGIAEIKQ